MSGDSDLLVRLALRLDEGDSVDWEAESAAHRELRSRLTVLKRLEQIAAAFRSLAPDAAPGIPPDPSSHPDAHPLRPDGVLQHGRLVGGRYRIRSLLGRGGMGVVYGADDERLLRPVALKVLRPDLLIEADARARFLREARLAAGLGHPGIATIYDVAEADGMIFIAMELLHGRTLARWLAERPLPYEEALRIALRIVDALAAAHTAGIVHRDIKPDNIVLMPGGEVKILDFGIARRLNRPERARGAMGGPVSVPAPPRAVRGTVSYLPPERIRGEVVDPRSDLFSFGVTLYQMLTGVPPFTRGTAIDTLAAILLEPVVPVSRVMPHLPVAVDAVIERCLHKDPDRRYQLAADLRRDLRRLLAGRRSAPGHRRRSSSRRRSSTSPQRHARRAQHGPGRP